MISEQEFIFLQNMDNINKNLYEKGYYEEPNKLIMKYFGNKNQIPLEYGNNKFETNSENEENTLLFI